MEEKKVGKEIELQKKSPPPREMANLGDLIPELVYKLNNHFASVIGYAQLLLFKMTDQEAKGYLERIIEEARQGSQIIKSVADFARKRKPQKEIVDLNKLIKMALAMEAPNLRFKRIDVIKELSPSIPLTQGDTKKIEQVLLNLINNAQEAISEFHGVGRIWVKTRVVKDQIEITISDDGPGIASENISKIFNPFFTTKEKGIGLGLTTSLDTIKEHRGTMRVRSEWGKGSTFIITLPIIKVEGEEKKEGEKSVKKSLKGKKGLVIDDEPSFLYLVSEYLEREGCEIMTATDAKTALTILEDRDFDFVICDIRMPEMSGIEFYRIIEEKKLSLKDRTIFSTGDTLGDTTRAFFELVTNPQVEKPFNFDELKEVIKSVL